MSSKLLRRAAIAPLLAVSAWASASQPIPMSAEQMDAVYAGNVASLPNLAPLASIGALAWAMSEVTTTPAIVVVIDGNVNARVGLSGNGVTFTSAVRIIRAN